MRTVPEDRRIALAALCVTAVVGVAAPLITWRAALSGQDRAAQDARHQADLTELRSVLDGSLEALDRLQIAVQFEMVAWERRMSAARYQAKHLASDRAYSAWLRERDRLTIRLGQNDELVHLYGRAGGETFAASLFMDGHRFGLRANSVRFGSLVNAGVRAKTAFEAVATTRFGTPPF
jgi:hypothetical protein